MKSSWSVAGAAAAVAAWSIIAPSAAQFVTPPKDLKSALGYAGIPVRYKQVPPGICETRPGVKSFSGYADVGKDEHLFFWFFEAREVHPAEAPLTVWINGGPGSSSMIGLFQELGPCGVDINGTLYNNPYSWNRKSNMLFIDQPATTGLSYTVPQNGYTVGGDFVAVTGNTCPDYAMGTCSTGNINDPTLIANSTDNAAPNMWKALQGFMGAFPQYSRHGFHFTTESYGGHYGPVFNEYFEQQNAKNISGAHKISLESVYIGNGWLDPAIGYIAYYNFTVFPGNTYDYRPYNKSTEQQVHDALFGKGNCLDQLDNCKRTGRNDVCSAADSFCASQIETPYDTITKRSEYDVRYLEPNPFPYEFYTSYLNSPKVQAAVGAFTNFTESSSQVGAAFSETGDDGREEGTIEAVQSLLKAGVRVNIVNGDADYNCNWYGGLQNSELIDAPGFSSAGFTDLQTSDHVVHGQVRQSGNFAFVRIYESGHEVPFYQPIAALELFERQICGKDIATGKVALTPDYKTKGPLVSTYREGNKTIQFELVPTYATYNTTTNAPNPYRKSNGTAASEMLIKYKLQQRL